MGHQGVGWGFRKFICFEKTDVASMDWSCYFPFVSTALITGYVSESDPMAYWSYPRDVALHEGSIALLFSMFSPTRISARSCSHGFSMCEIRSQELADSPPQDVCVWSLEDTLEIVLTSFYSSPSIWLESSFVLVRYPNTTGSLVALAEFN